MKKAKCEIGGRSHGLHIIITLANENVFRLSIHDGSDEITLLCEDGTIIIKPSVANEIKIGTTHKPPTP